jgi:hypothetical protein
MRLFNEIPAVVSVAHSQKLQNFLLLTFAKTENTFFAGSSSEGDTTYESGEQLQSNKHTIKS